jgi:hypothetical protein
LTNENFFYKKKKIGHGGPPQNLILRSTTVTEFSKTFPVFYKWPDLTDVQVALTSTVHRTFHGKILISNLTRIQYYNQSFTNAVSNVTRATVDGWWI